MNMVRLVFKKLWHLGRLIMAKLRLVVAMRLHKQLSSFQLRISSNTPSCSEEIMNGTLLLIRKARAFYFANLAWEMHGRTGTIAIYKSSSTRQTDLQISFTQWVWLQLHRLRSQVKVHQPSDWFLSWQGLVTLRRGHPRGPWTITVSLQDSIWARLKQGELAPQQGAPG
jgi:hypothetical protein